MAPDPVIENGDTDVRETQECLDSLEAVVQTQGPDRARFLLSRLDENAARYGVELPFNATTPYVNTIPPEKQAPLRGNREIERRIKSLARWNAMAMVVRANKNEAG